MTTLTTSDGNAIEWDSVGRPDATPMLLIEGLGAQLVGWRDEFCELLAACGFRVVRFDNRDAGLSQKFPLGGYTLLDMARDVEELLDGLGISQAHVVGQSMGGMIGQIFAINFPERVLSLTMCYTAPSDAYILPGRRSIDGLLKAPRATTREEAIELFVESESDVRSTAYPFDVQWVREKGGLMWDRCYAPDGIARQRQAIAGGFDTLPQLPDLTCPTLVIHGSDDRLIEPAGSEAIHDAIPGSELIIFDGMGHELPKELWPEIVDAIATNALRATRTVS
ncbi:MAG: alpha/beta hydrolase [Actinomycetota bacterium]|nr:alpha/beta hydrolase [Actinomycetota bacterium]